MGIFFPGLKRVRAKQGSNLSSKASLNPSLESARLGAQRDVRELRRQIDHLGKLDIDLILTRARSHYAWQNRPVTNEQIHRRYDIVKMGPTSMNGCPARFVFVQSRQGKEKLAKSVKPTNLPKLMGAPLTVIVAYDFEFWKELPRLFPHEDRRGNFSGKPEYAEETAFRNSTLQGGYLMIAARALGLVVGPMSGFTNSIVDEEFFAGTTVRSNFLCNIGYADEEALFQRLPRFEFEDVCRFA